MTKVIKGFLLGASLIILLLGIITDAYLVSSGRFGEPPKIYITEFLICDMDISSYSNDNSIKSRCGTQFSNGTKQLYVCGNINADAASTIPLSFYLYKGALKTLIYSSPVGTRIRNGFFCHNVLLPNVDQKGFYQVKVYYYRYVVASSMIEIR